LLAGIGVIGIGPKPSEASIPCNRNLHPYTRTSSRHATCVQTMRIPPDESPRPTLARAPPRGTGRCLPGLHPVTITRPSSRSLKHVPSVVASITNPGSHYPFPRPVTPVFIFWIAVYDQFVLHVPPATVNCSCANNGILAPCPTKRRLCCHLKPAAKPTFLPRGSPLPKHGGNR